MAIVFFCSTAGFASFFGTNNVRIPCLNSALMSSFSTSLATSKHIRKLYKRKHDSVTDYLHKVTRYLAEYCREQGITCVVAGDIRNIRREKDLGHRTNQKFHSLPYNRIYIMLEYKLKRYGIRFIKQPANKKSRLNWRTLKILYRLKIRYQNKTTTPVLAWKY